MSHLAEMAKIRRASADVLQSLAEKRNDPTLARLAAGARIRAGWYETALARQQRRPHVRFAAAVRRWLGWGAR